MGSSPGANLRMQLAREARVVAGITLFAAPTIVYGGITSVGMLAKGTAGLAPGHGQGARRLQAWRLTHPGWSHASLTETLGVSEGVVSRRVRRARAEGPESLRRHPPPGAPR